MDQQPRLNLVVSNGVENPVEGDDLVANTRIKQPQDEKRSSEDTGHGDSRSGKLIDANAIACDEDRSVVLTEAAPDRKQSVATGQVRVRMKRDGGNLVFTLERFPIQRLDVVENVRVSKVAGRDLAGGQAVKHECVIGIGAVGDSNLSAHPALQRYPSTIKSGRNCRHGLPGVPTGRAGKDIVDQAGPADPDRARYPNGPADLGHRLHFGVDNLQVFEPGPRLGSESGSRRGQDGGGIPLAGGDALSPHAERTVEDRGCAPLLWAQVLIPRAKGQPVTFPDRGYRGDPDRHVEISDHALDHGKLLDILFAEVGHVGLDDVEELQHDGGHAPEMARPERPAQVPALRTDIHIHALLLGMHVANARGEHQISLMSLRKLQVLLQAARIELEVLVGTELQGIDEDTDDPVRALESCLIDQLAVSSMQRAHGGNEADAMVGVPSAVQTLSERPDVLDQLGTHRIPLAGGGRRTASRVCSAPGKRPERTSST